MKKYDYSIKSLHLTFIKHAEKFQKDCKNRIKKHKKYFPKEPLPDHEKETFCISAALSSICKKILDLEKRLDKEKYPDF